MMTRGSWVMVLRKQMGAIRIIFADYPFLFSMTTSPKAGGNSSIFQGFHQTTVLGKMGPFFGRLFGLVFSQIQLPYTRPRINILAWLLVLKKHKKPFGPQQKSTSNVWRLPCWWSRQNDFPLPAPPSRDLYGGNLLCNRCLDWSHQGRAVVWCVIFLVNTKTLLPGT